MTDRNRNEEPERERKLVEVGEWPVQALDYALGFAGTGTEQVGVQLIITDGPSKGMRRTWYGFFTDAAMETTIKGLRALGWSSNDISQLDEIVGGKATAVFEHERDDRDGSTRDRIRWINGNMGVVMKERMNTADVARLNQKLRGVAARLGGGKPPAGGGEQWGNREPAPPPREQRQGDGWQTNGRGRAQPTGPTHQMPWEQDAPPLDDRDQPPQRGGRR